VKGKVEGASKYLRPKDSNAMVGVRNHTTGKALETVKQTDFTRVIVR